MNEQIEQRWVVDSIEESVAAIEVDGDTTITVPQTVLPLQARQGDVLRVQVARDGDGKRSVATIEIDGAATKAALAASAAQVKKGTRQRNDPGGNIVL